MSRRSLEPLACQAILRPNATRIGRCYVAYPGWGGVRWLFPAEAALRRTGLHLMTGKGWKRFIGWHLIASRWFCGRRMWLDTAPLEEALARAVGEPEVRLAFSLGTPGAYRKLTVQIMAGGGVAAYGKIAEHPLAQSSLEREHETLNRLARVDALIDRVPRSLAWFPWGNARVLILTPGRGNVGSSRLMASHVQFLRALQGAFEEYRPFESSAMWHRMVATARRFDALLPDRWSARYRRALDHLSVRLAKATLPLSLAHRDFTPWNTRVAPQGLFVFDWEAAAAGTTPLYDALHFHAMQAALLGRAFRPPLHRLKEILATLWPGGGPYLSDLWLAYLTDMGLYYTEARLQRPDAGEETVWSWFGREIDAQLGRSHGVA